MSNTIAATFDVTAWDEHQFDRHAGTGKLTRAKVNKSYHGDISADSLTEWLMSYSDDGTACFVGLERIIGTVESAKERSSSSTWAASKTAPPRRS